MNPVQRACATLGISEAEGMNRLQEHGIVSDNAVWSTDLSKEEQVGAAEWLLGRPV